MINKKAQLILLSFIVTGILLYPRLSIVVSTKMFYSRDKLPSVYVTPESRSLKLYNKDIEGGSDLDCEWFRFKAPWKYIETMEPMENAKIYRFEGDRGIYVEKKSEDSGIAKNLLGEDPEKVEKILGLIGEENLSSEYRITSMCLNTTPDQATFFKPYDELAAIPLMLVLKALFSAEEIYELSIPGYRAFEYVKNDRLTTVSLFDENNTHIEIGFVSASRDEVDYVLSSISKL